MPITDNLDARFDSACRAEQEATADVARLACEALAAETPGGAAYLELRQDHYEGTVAPTGIYYMTTGAEHELSEPESRQVYPWVATLDSRNADGWTPLCFRVGGTVEHQLYLLDLKEAAGPSGHHAETGKCPYCNYSVDSVADDGVCTECHVHSLGDWPTAECGCSDCEENASEHERDIRAFITCILDRIAEHEAAWRWCKEEGVPSFNPDTGEAAQGPDTDRLDEIETEEAFDAQIELRAAAKTLRKLYREMPPVDLTTG